MADLKGREYIYMYKPSGIFSKQKQEGINPVDVEAHSGLVLMAY